jgi:hypothetical protein
MVNFALELKKRILFTFHPTNGKYWKDNTGNRPGCGRFL